MNIAEASCLEELRSSPNIRESFLRTTVSKSLLNKWWAGEVSLSHLCSDGISWDRWSYHCDQKGLFELAELPSAVYFDEKPHDVKLLTKVLLILCDKQPRNKKLFDFL